MDNKLGATELKKLIRETSVREYFVELKKDSLTEQGFFDLIKVPGLRITGAGKFLKKLRVANRLTQPEFSKIFKLTSSRVGDWENNRRTIPIQFLVKIAKENGVSKDSIYSLIDQGEFKTRNSLPATFVKVSDVIHLFNPMLSTKGSGVWPIYVNTRLKKNLSEINSILNVEIVSTKTNQKLIYSKELHNFLMTFFNYKEVLKINPPLTSEVKRWFEMGVDLKRAIIIPCLQSDGCIGKSDLTLTFSGNSKVLHDYFVDAMFFEYNILPTSYFKQYKVRNSNSKIYYIHRTEFVQNPVKDIIDEVMKLAGNTKTKPANNQTIDEYIKEPQPHLNYLINATEVEQRIAFRIWTSTEGCIYVWRSSKKNVYPALEIACAHPKLIEQLRQIALLCNIKMNERRSKQKWSGKEGLCSFSLKACVEFLKLGGFIKGVKISSHSKYHKDIDKDILILGILEFKIRQKKNPRLRKLSCEMIHQEINEIIRNEKYKTDQFYINYFHCKRG